VEVPLGSGSSLTALYSPEEEWKYSAKLIRYKNRVSHFDFHIIAAEKQWVFHDYTRLDTATGGFPGKPQKRSLLGADTAGEAFGLGIWAEFAYNWMEESKDFCELVIGGDYTFDFQTYVMVEYYRNTLGKTDHKNYGINDWMRFYASEQKAIARDQVYLLIQHPAMALLDLGLISVYSLSDGSAALVPTLRYSLSDNVDVFAYLNVNLGGAGKVFGKNTGSGGLLRVRVYF